LIGFIQTHLLNNFFNQSNFDRYSAYLKSTTLSDASLKRKLSSLSSFQKFLIKKKLIDQPISNPSLIPSLDRAGTKSNPILNIFKKIKFAPLSRGAVQRTEGFKSKSFLTYLILASLLIIAAGTGYTLYRQTITKAKLNFAYTTAGSPVYGNRFLSFQGRLTDTSGNPINTSTSIVFELYNDPSVGTTLYTSATGNSQTIVPDENGIFSVTIGKSHGTTIPDSVFTQNSSVYLQITAGSETMSPRQPIATVGYAVNSESLQGLPPSASGLKNTVLVVDSTGNLNLGETSPTIKSTSGTLGIEGQAVLVKASDGSGGNITINPDASGVIQFLTEGTAPNNGTGFINATNANLATGNLFNATINNLNRGYNFINFSNYSVGTTVVSRFSVDAYGNTNIGGTLSPANISIGNTLLTATAANLNLLTGLTPSNGSIIYSNATNLVTSAVGTSGQVLASNGAAAPSWVTIPGAITYTATNGLNLNGSAFGLGGTLTQNTNIGVSSFDLTFTNSGTLLNLNHSGNVGIGTTNPIAKMEINTTGTNTTLRLNGSLTGALPVDFDPFIYGVANAGFQLSIGSTQRLVINSAGNVGIGITNPTLKLDVNGGFRSVDTSSGLGFVFGELAGYNRMKLYPTGPSIRFLNTSDSYANLGFGGLSVGDYAGVAAPYQGAIIQGMVGIGNSNPGKALDVTGDIKVTNQLFVGAGYTGTPGQVLSSTGVGLSWINTASTTYTASTGITLVGSDFQLNLASPNVWTTRQTFANGIGVTGNSYFSGPINGTSASFYGSVGLYFTSPDTFSSGLSIYKRGTTGDSTAPVTNGSELGYNSFYGWDSSAYSRGSYVIVRTLENWTSSARGASYNIYTADIGTTVQSQRLSLASNISTLTSTVFKVSGTEIVTSNIGVTGNISVNGQFYVGTGFTGAPGQILTSTGVGLSWITDSGTGTTVTYTAGNGLNLAGLTFGLGGTLTQNTRLNIGSTEVMYFSTSGNVGIGFTNPFAKLDVNGQLYSHDTTRVLAGAGNTVSQIGWSGTDSGQFSLYTSGNLKILLNSAGNSYFNSGNVGIGTTNPLDKLHIYNGNLLVEENYGLNVNDSQAGAINMIRYDTSNDQLQIGTSTANGLTGGISFDVAGETGTAMTILNNGNVGIGTTNPNAKLELVGDALGFMTTSSEKARRNIYDPVTTWVNTGATLPASMSNAASYIVGSYIYLLGNTSNNYIYKTPINNPLQWVNTGDTNANSFVYGNKAVIINDYVYVFGGGGTPFATANIIRAPINNPTKWVDTGATLPNAILGFSQTSIIGDYVYIFGGNANGIGITNTIIRAPLSNPTAFVNTGSTLPSKLINSQSAIIGNYIYTFGGNNGSIINKIYRAPLTNPTSWIDTGSTLPANIQESQLLTIGDYVYLLGGNNGGTNNKIYGAPLSNPLSWVDTGSTLPGNLYDAQSLVVGDNAYLIGGSSNVIYRAGIKGASEESNTAKYAPNADKFYNQSLSTSLFSDGMGNIGLGTTSPSQKLDIVGSMELSGQLYVGTGFTGAPGQVLTSTGVGLSWITASGTTYTAGNGITLSGTTFQLGGQLTQNTQIGTSSFGLSFVGLGNTQSLYLASSGYVGIGTTAPISLLTILGDGSSSSSDFTILNANNTKNIEIRTGLTNLYNTFIGVGVGASNTTGSNNTVYGYQSLLSNSTGNDNTAIGIYSLNHNISGSDNVALGGYSLTANTTGSYNSAIGWNALNANTTGQENTATGMQALKSNTTGSYNSAFGEHSLTYNTTGIYNTAVGREASYLNYTGYNNIAIGGLSLRSNSTGHDNVANGLYSLNNLIPTSGSIASFSDYSGTVAGTVLVTSYSHGLTGTSTKQISGTANYNGSYTVTVVDPDTFYFTHTWLGTETGQWAIESEGRYNTAIGNNSGRTLITGSLNTLLGYQAGYNFLQKTNAVNSMALGANTYNTADNQVVIGDLNITQTLLNGFVGIGTTAPRAKLELVGDALGFMTTSSEKARRNVYDPVTTWVDTGSTLPGNLYYSKSLIIGNYVYLFGGNDTNGWANPIYKAPLSNPTSWVSAGTLPKTTYKAPIEIIGNNLYLYGGATSSNPYQIYTAPISNPTNWSIVGNTLPGVIYVNNSQEIIGNYIYFFGGAGNSKNIYRAPLNNPTNVTDTGSTLAYNIGSGGSVIIGDYVYIFGSANITDNTICRAPLSNPLAWMDTGATLAHDYVSDSQFVTIGDYVYALGNGNGSYYNIIDRAPLSNPLAWVNTGSTLPIASLYSSQASVIGDNVYLFGGWNSSNGGATNVILRAGIKGASEESNTGKYAPNADKNYNQSLSTSLFSDGIGNLGINTTSPHGLFQINDDVGGTGPIFLVTSNGYVGIGTTSPSQKLDIVGSMELSGQLYVGTGFTGAPGQVLTSTGVGLSWATASGSSYTAGNGLNLAGSVFGLGGTLTQNTRLNIGSTEVMYFQLATGNVGFGTTNPNAKLELVGDALGFMTTSSEKARRNVYDPVTTWVDTGSTLPVSMYDFKSIIIGNYIYSFGGYDGSTYISSIYKAPLSNPTAWVDTGSTLPTGINNMSLSIPTIINNYIYFFGASNSRKIYKTPISNPTAWVNTGSTLPGLSSFDNNQTAVIGDYVYIFGGPLQNKIYSAPIANPTAWIDTGSTLPVTSLWSSQLNIINNNIYLFGGNLSNNSTNKILSAPISNPTAWIDTGSTLPSNNEQSQSAIIGDYVYLFGGWPNGFRINNIYKAPLSNPTAWVNTGSTLPNNLGNSQISVIGDNVYLFGGFINSATNKIYRAGIKGASEESNTGKYAPNANKNYNQSLSTSLSSDGIGNLSTSGNLSASTFYDMDNSNYYLNLASIGQNSNSLSLTEGGSIKFNVASAGTSSTYISSGHAGSRIQGFDNGFSLDTGTSNAGTVAWNTQLFLNSNGNVGIGTTNPLGLLQIGNKGTGVGEPTNHGNLIIHDQQVNGPEATGGIEFKYNTSSSGFGDKIYTNNAFDYFGIATRYGSASWTERLVIQNQTGNVGIGTTNPQYKLEIKDNSTTPIVSSIENTNSSDGANATFQLSSPDSGLGFYTYSTATTGTVLGIPTADSAVIRSWSGKPVSSLIIGTPTAAPIYFSTNSVPSMSILSGGNVGIGTTNSTQLLNINNSSYGTPATSGIIQARGDLRLSTNNDNLVLDMGMAMTGAWLQTTNKIDLSLNYPLLLNPNGGNVGIGTTAPIEALQIKGNQRMFIGQEGASRKGLLIAATDAEVNAGYVRLNPFDYGASANLNLYIPSNVGIGVNPNYKLDIQGSGTNASPLAIRAGTNLGTVNQSVDLKFYESTGSIATGAITNVTQSSTDIALAFSSYTSGLNERMRISGNGNVGIGTTSPSQKLDVAGNITASGGNLYLESTDAAGMYINADTANNYINFLDNSAAIGTLQGSIGIDSTYATARANLTTLGANALSVKGKGYFGDKVGISTTGPVSLLSVGAIPTSGFNIPTVAGFYSSTDNDGIIAVSRGGIGNPQSIRIGANQSTLSSSIQALREGIGYNILALNTLGGNVGIGTSSPLKRLEVNMPHTSSTEDEMRIGSVFSSNFYGVGFNYALNSIGTPIRSIADYYSGTKYVDMTFDRNKVGINNTAPAYALDVIAAGTTAVARFKGSAAYNSCSFTTSGTLICSSDSRLKKNIEDLNYGLDTLNQLRPVDFNWNTDANGTQKSLGFIAQEVQPLMPELVSVDPDGYEQLNTIAMTPMIVKSIQEQQGQINKLQSLLPDLNITSTGQINVNYNVSDEVLVSLGYSGSKNEIESATYNLTDSIGNIINHIGQFSELTSAKIKTGLLSATNVVTKNMVAENIISPKATIDKLTVTTATISGTLTAQNIQTTEVDTQNLTAQDATVSGTLYANNIISSEGSFGDLMTSKISSLRDELKNIVNTKIATESALLAESHDWSASVASDSAQISGDLSLSNNLIVGAKLMVNGDTQLANAFISGTFTAGEIAIKDNIIETTNTALYIQPSKTGSIHIMGDTLVIADNGDVTITGNVTVNGSLFANLIKADEIQTNKLTAADLTSDKVNIATDSASTIIATDTDINLATSSAKLTSNATAGTATLPAGKTDLIISTDKLTANSMVYLTPVGSTQNQVLYIKNKVTDSNHYFTIALDNPLSQDVQINWWIIN
jgi:hypothetical protein